MIDIDDPTVHMLSIDCCMRQPKISQVGWGGPGKMVKVQSARAAASQKAAGRFRKCAAPRARCPVLGPHSARLLHLTAISSIFVGSLLAVVQGTSGDHAKHTF
jgi:hypothetical protein